MNIQAVLNNPDWDDDSFTERPDRLSRDYESASLLPEMFNVSEHSARCY